MLVYTFNIYIVYSVDAYFADMSGRLTVPKKKKTKHYGKAIKKKGNIFHSFSENQHIIFFMSVRNQCYIFTFVLSL